MLQGQPYTGDSLGHTLLASGMQREAHLVRSLVFNYFNVEQFQNVIRVETSSCCPLWVVKDP